MSFVELQQVSRAYGSGEKTFYALDHIDLTMEKGEFVVVLGPSGAGKSTLLNLLGGMDSPTGGSIRIGDRDIAAMNGKQLTKFRASNVGFVFQFYNIMPTLTVEENVGIIRDVTETDYDVMDVLAGVGLQEHATKFPSELSGGEQQRVSIAQAIMKKPDVLLCDEPTGALDSNTGVGVLQLLRDQTKNGTTVIVVTHNTLIAEIADRVIRLKNGKVQSNELNPAPKAISEVSW
jgi:putative ABC transport system ATP-binding protein